MVGVTGCGEGWAAVITGGVGRRSWGRKGVFLEGDDCGEGERGMWQRETVVGTWRQGWGQGCVSRAHSPPRMSSGPLVRDFLLRKTQKGHRDGIDFHSDADDSERSSRPGFKGGMCLVVAGPLLPVSHLNGQDLIPFSETG